MTHKVSIIIPFYNRFELLFKTLKSVKNQTYKNFEVILVDDCSEEQLNLEIVEEILGNIPLRYTRLSLNSGPGVARSAGRAMAQGDYIAYLDSDDEWDENFLNCTVQVLNEELNCSMVFTNTIIKTKDHIRVKNKLKEGTANFFELIINKKIYWATGAVLWRSEITNEKNWSKYRDHEDYLHDIKSLLKKPSIYFLPEKLCIVHKNELLGIPRNNSEMLKVFIFIARRFLQPKFRKSINFHHFILNQLKKRKYDWLEFRFILQIYFIFILKGYIIESVDLLKIFIRKLN